MEERQIDKMYHHHVQVEIVRIPGEAGEFGVTAGHIPCITQLKAGVVHVYPTKTSEAEQWFVSGGFSFFHKDNKLDIAGVEAFKVDDLDAKAVQAQLADSKARMDSAAAGSEDHAKAKIEYETCVAMNSALA